MPRVENDLAVLDGLIIDATGAPAEPGALLVRGERIAEVRRGRVEESEFAARRVIDTKGGVFENGEQFGLDEAFRRASFASEDRDSGCEVIRKAHRMGIRVVTGGDYGFAWVPHGGYAKDLAYFARHMGFTPMEAIIAATRHGAELLRMAGDCGTLERGKFADFLVVDGNPLDDIAILSDRSRLTHVFKGGEAVAERGGPACRCQSHAN
jgi:imidazolonepropionase-like amidohydrolase